jgi:hypothetical protein
MLFGQLWWLSHHIDNHSSTPSRHLRTHCAEALPFGEIIGAQDIAS